MKVFQDHFSTHAAGYAAHRPSYPAALASYLAGVAPTTKLALDVGCGSGQMSTLLAQCFDRVIATDASAEQIANAQPHERVDYRVARAERSELEDGAFALITVAQAAHWFDLDAFYAEARRVMQPGGVIALITYGVTHLDQPEANAVLQDFYTNVVGPYWPPERRLVEEGYRSLPFPFKEFKTAPALAMEADWSFTEVLGYVDTWSAVRAAERTLGRAPIDAFRSKLAQTWGEPAQRIAVKWPLSLRIGARD